MLNGVINRQSNMLNGVVNRQSTVLCYMCYKMNLNHVNSHFMLKIRRKKLTITTLNSNLILSNTKEQTVDKK